MSNGNSRGSNLATYLAWKINKIKKPTNSAPSKKPRKPPENQTNVSNAIVRLFKEIDRMQSSTPDNLTSSVITGIAKNANLNFTELTDVYIFVMSIFADYNHDIGTIDTIAGKLLSENYTNRSKIPPDMMMVQGEKAGILKIFANWIGKIRWLSPDIRNQLLTIVGKTPLIDNILVNAFGQTARSINEDIFMAGIFEYMENDSKGQPLPFCIVNSKDVFNAQGGAKTHISFNQSSKSSAPATYSAFMNDYKVDVALPMLADKGVTQTSNPLLYFNQRLSRCLTLDSAANTEKKLKAQQELAEDYVINWSDSFKITFQFLGNTFFEYTYKYSGYTILVEFETFGRGRIITPILSASDISDSKKRVDTSTAIAKTCADIGIIVYGIVANSISVTGDRAAGTTGMFFSYLMSKTAFRALPNKPTVNVNRNKVPRLIVNNNKGLYSRFLFEVEFNSVIIPTYSSFRPLQFKTMSKRNGRWTSVPLNFGTSPNLSKLAQARRNFNIYAKSLTNKIIKIPKPSVLIRSTNATWANRVTKQHVPFNNPRPLLKKRNYEKLNVNARKRAKAKTSARPGSAKPTVQRSRSLGNNGTGNNGTNNNGTGNNGTNNNGTGNNGTNNGNRRNRRNDIMNVENV